MLQIQILSLILGALCQGMCYYSLPIALQMADALNMHFEFNFYIIIHIEYGNEYE